MSFIYRHGDRPLEGYTILRGIGRGGFGEVYFALSDGGREVALKVIQQNVDVELRGVRHCMNLKSPHLISIFDVKRNGNGVPFVIMEYVAGTSLRDILREHSGGLSGDRATYLVREIGRGLDYLHERGIVHRDLKPENIFWEDGYVKIGDYGLSKYISVSRQSGQTISVGTVHYMAPEIGSGNYHRGIDIYALGVIFYELLTGQVPYNGDSMAEILMKHLTSKPDLDKVDEVFRPVIAKALAKKPEERYGRVDEMIVDLLVDPEIARRVESVDPASFITPTPDPTPLLEVVEEQPASAPVSPPPSPTPAPAPPASALESADTMAVPGPSAKAPEEDAAPAPQPDSVRRRSRRGEGRRGFFGEDLEQRIAQGAATAAGMALALSFFTERTFSVENIAGCFLIILAGAVSILVLDHWATPRFRIDLGIAKRVMTLGIAGPSLAISMWVFPVLGRRYAEALPSIFVSLMLIQWSERTRQDRQEPASLGQAFMAGLCGLVVSWILQLRGREALFVGGLMASISLVVNAASPYFRSRTARRKAGKEPAKGVEGDAEPSPDPSREKTGEEPAVAGKPSAAKAAGAAGAAGTSERPGGRKGARSALVRPADDRWLVGVCSGIASHLGWEPFWVRLVFILSVVPTGGATLIAYFVLYVTMPDESVAGRPLEAASARPAANPPEKNGTRQPLVRLTADRMVAGVCAGIAARYDWEIVWVRVAALAAILLTAGYALIAYVILWIVMPAERSFAEVARDAGARLRRAGGGARALWYTVFAVLHLAGLAGLVIAGIAWARSNGFDRAPREEVVIPLVLGVLGVALSLFAFYRARLRERISFWNRTAGPLLLVISLSAFTSLVAISALHSIREDDVVTAFGAGIVISGLLSAFLASRLIGAARQRRLAGEVVGSRPETLAGWAHLGALLVVAALALVIAGSALSSNFALSLLQSENVDSPWELVTAAREGAHLVAGLLLYLPGLFCLLMARRRGGAAHVLRGAIGWSCLGLLVGLIAVVVPQHASDGFVTVGWLRLGTPESWLQLVTFFLAAVISIACIAWPGRSIAVTGGALATADRDVERMIR